MPIQQCGITDMMQTIASRRSIVRLAQSDLEEQFKDLIKRQIRAEATLQLLEISR